MERDELQTFFNSLDRSLFIEGECKRLAGIDAPLPIGYGQTISQPSLVAEMTYALNIDKDCRVLEIGTGSGYQTAFLAEFSGSVYTVELIAELSRNARTRLDKLGYNNIYYKTGDGSEGWREQAPYDSIIVTAASERTPAELLTQLKNGGRMIAPIGPRSFQELMLITKDKDGFISEESIGKVVFVEFKGKYGFGK
jgi:protein-L-isoaspartate(D-aspartate) O-methyltransferase